VGDVVDLQVEDGERARSDPSGQLEEHLEAVSPEGKIGPELGFVGGGIRSGRGKDLVEEPLEGSGIRTAAEQARPERRVGIEADAEQGSGRRDPVLQPVGKSFRHGDGEEPNGKGVASRHRSTGSSTLRPAAAPAGTRLVGWRRTHRRRRSKFA
jgi:hypothetical protein